MFIKIDTEGNEASLLQGGVRTLQKIKPDVVFGSNASSDVRIQLFGFFKSHGLGPYVLTFTFIAAPLCWGT